MQTLKHYLAVYRKACWLYVEQKEYLYWGMDELKNRGRLPSVPEPRVTPNSSCSILCRQAVRRTAMITCLSVSRPYSRSVYSCIYTQLCKKQVRQEPANPRIKSPEKRRNLKLHLLCFSNWVREILVCFLYMREIQMLSLLGSILEKKQFTTARCTHELRDNFFKNIK